jgi:hypothetical protein
MDAIATVEVTVTDPCNGGISDTVTVDVGEVTLSIEDNYFASGSQGAVVTLSMCNKYNKVKGLQTDIDDDGNYLTCTSCSPDPARAMEFTCSANDLGDKCRIILASINPAAGIEEGCGPIATIDYDVSPSAPSDGCIDITPSDSEVADMFNDPLCVCEETGEICFIICGDVYPADCLGQPECGDGVVDIFDILEEIDFVLGEATPTDCQFGRANVPQGTPPYCSAPDGLIQIYDVLVIIDMALGKANCCDYWYLGKIW